MLPLLVLLLLHICWPCRMVGSETKTDIGVQLLVASASAASACASASASAASACASATASGSVQNGG